MGRRSFDQLDRSGHLRRTDDLDLIAGLGITALRYPVLWEHVAPDGDLSRADWSRSDERLEHLRELGVRPIVGLLHHGNGPSDTDLLDPAFPERFAAYAAVVAERYPWVDAYIPVNEPLTTARFCGMYGFWHPHGRDRATMAKILHHQLHGSILAMRAIRDVNPRAEFIQNEDIAKVHATPTLAYEAAMQNERRWLTFDLLAGRVDPSHPMWPVFADAIGTEAIEAYVESPFPPDVVGFDHYVTSERFLDDALDPYPERYRSENGRHVFADVEAVWSLSDGPAGVEALLEEAWSRYELPIALTEVHLGGTRDEQMRWLVESYEAAVALRARGADVRGVTVWALLGMYDWNSLMLDPSGFYESGAFDVRDGTLRPTALAELIRELASGRPYTHPVLSVPGWWRRPERLIYRREQAPAPAAADAHNVRRIGSPVAPERADLHSVGGTTTRRRVGPRLALVTNGGMLADAFRTACATRGLAFDEVEIGRDAEPEVVAEAIRSIDPWAVVDTLGFGPTDGVATEEAALGQRLRQSAVDAIGAAHGAAARSADTLGVAMLAASSWTVFAGRDDRPRTELETPDATTDLGRAWQRAETAVLEAAPSAFVVRPGPLLGSPLVPVKSQDTAGSLIVAPSFGPDVANVALDLLIDGETGVWHLANAGLASVVADARLRASCVLGTARAVVMPTLDDARKRAVEVPALLAHDDDATPAAASEEQDEVSA